MKNFNGKAIYNPSGKAGEYSYWACNFYVGCSNGCEYCYCKKGILKPVMGMDKPQLKKCFKDDIHAFEVFLTEMNRNTEDLKKHGIFFSFTTDPMLPETLDLTLDAASNAVLSNIPVKILTKCTAWVDEFLKNFDRHEINLQHIVCPENPFESKKHLYAFGFTLTGHDELEPGASTNAERIEAMQKLHNAGFRTWASIEPVIDCEASYEMILKSYNFCKLFKIGLLSGKQTNTKDIYPFVVTIKDLAYHNGFKVYFKDSLLKAAGIAREELPSNCVSRDFNIFQ